MKTWIHRICFNVLQDHYRRSRWTSLWNLGDARAEEAPSDSDIEASQAAHELVERALQKLSLKERAVVVLYYLEESSIEDICAALHLPEGTVKSRLHAARAKLQDYLGKEGVDV